MESISIVTPVTRPQNLYLLKANILFEIVPYFDKVTWYHVYDPGKENQIEQFNERWIESFLGGISNDSGGGSQRNEALEKIQEGWVCFLDDDNAFFKGYGKRMREIIDGRRDVGAIIVSQKRESGNLIAKPSYMKPGHIDTAQVLLKREIIGKRRYFEDVYQSDYFFIKKIYKENKDKFLFVDEFLCHYNFLRQR